MVPNLCATNPGCVSLGLGHARWVIAPDSDGAYFTVSYAVVQISSRPNVKNDLQTQSSARTTVGKRGTIEGSWVPQ